MVKEKGNYKYRSLCMAAEVGLVLQGLAAEWGVIHGKPGRHILGVTICIVRSEIP